MMMTVLLFAVGFATSAPIVAAVLVSMASNHEESAQTLGGPPPGPVCAAARRIVAFRSPDLVRPGPPSRDQACEPARQWQDAWSPAKPEPAWPVPVSIR